MRAESGFHVIGEVETIPKELDLDIEWRIKDFCSLPDRADDWYDSPPFYFAGESWRFVIYPNGRIAQNTLRYVDLFLERQSLGPSINLDFSFSLRTLDGEKDYESRHSNILFKQWDLVGRPRFISRSELLKRQSVLLPFGVLTMVFTLHSPKYSRRASDVATAERVHCKKNVDDKDFSTEKKEEVNKCPQCSDIVELPDWNEHKCQTTNVEGLEKLHVAYALVIILIAILTACIYAYLRTPLLLTHSYEEGVKKIQNGELNKAVQSEVSGLYDAIANSDQTVATKTKESGGVRNVQPKEIFRKSTEILRKPTGIKNAHEPKVVEINEPKASSSNPASTTKTKESESPPTLIVTDVGPTYLNIVWVLSEESKRNTAYYSVHFRKFGAKWKIFMHNVSQTSSNLTNLDAGVTYQIYVVAVGPTGIRKSSDTATVRTSYEATYDDPSTGPGILVVVSTSIIIIISVTACVFAYFKMPLPPTLPNREEAKENTSDEVNNVKGNESEVAESNESEASCSNESEASCSNETDVTECKEETVSVFNLPEDCGFVTDVNKLLKEKKGVDVTFVLESPSGKTEFFAHQLILSIMSSYFADQFYGKQRHKGHQTISLKGTCPTAFERMLRYCYGYKPGLETSEEVCALFSVASQFKVMGLINLCRTFFKYAKIDPGYVFKVLEISEETEDKSLKDKCYKVLEEKTRDVLASYELRDVTPAIAHIILDLQKLSLRSEYELIKWMFDWAKVKSGEQGSICTNTRVCLETFLKDMNFLSLTIEEFAMLCGDNPNFFSLNEIARISLNIGLPGTREMPEWYGRDLTVRVYTRSKE